MTTPLELISQLYFRISAFHFDLVESLRSAADFIYILKAVFGIFGFGGVFYHGGQGRTINFLNDHQQISLVVIIGREVPEAPVKFNLVDVAGRFPFRIVRLWEIGLEL